MVVPRGGRLLQQWRLAAQRSPNYALSFLHHRFSSIGRLQQGASKQELSSLSYTLDSRLCAEMLQDCIKNGHPVGGESIHCNILKRGNCLDLFSWNILLNLYTKTGRLLEGATLFDEMLERNVVSFVTMIQGYMNFEEYGKAVDLIRRLHREGIELNPFVFTTILKLIITLDWRGLVCSIHACVHKLGHDSDSYVGTALIDAYSVSGSLSSAMEVFKGVVGKDMVCWTGLVASHAENGCFKEALELFSQMRREGYLPNNFTFASVIKACIGLEYDGLGMSIHGCILKACYEVDPYVGVSLLDLYTSIGNLEDARSVFEEIPKDDVVPWSFMIARYSQSNHCEEALGMFHGMLNALVRPNQFTLASVLQACATMSNLQLGTQVHCHMVKAGLDLNVFSFNALMDVYAKCGKMEASANLFLHSRNKNEVSWNTMLVGYVQLGEAESAFGLFIAMQQDQVRPTEVTYSSLLRASASLAALEAGVQIHTMTIKESYDDDGAVSNALVDMYAKCGRIKEARNIFNTMNERDVVSWNSIVSAYSMHGLGAEALEMFENMQKSDVIPNHLTFVAVLSACSNTGFLDQGQYYFTSMREDFGIKPCMEHYTCMVSLFGRLGHLDKAVQLIEEIPEEPSLMLWRALLGACAAHNNVELGTFAADRVLELDTQDESTYVLLSNIYATAKKFDKVAVVRKRMKKERVKKEPGLSWVENQGIVHYFAVGDDSHQDIKLIRGMLEWLNLKTRAAGYTPNNATVLLDVEEDDKAPLLWQHSERIALAFAILRLPPGSPIHIIKNLRICADCHVAMKFASRIVDREIIVRDINRFHHIHDGACSCNDYW